MTTNKSVEHQTFSGNSLVQCSTVKQRSSLFSVAEQEQEAVQVGELKELEFFFFARSFTCLATGQTGQTNTAPQKAQRAGELGSTCPGDHRQRRASRGVLARPCVLSVPYPPLPALLSSDERAAHANGKKKRPDSEMGVYIGPCDLTSVKLIQKRCSRQQRQENSPFLASVRPRGVPRFRPAHHLAVMFAETFGVANCVSVHPFSLSLPSHGASHMTFTLAHTLPRSRSGPHGGATGGNRRILRRYDLLSIQARLPLFAPRWRRLQQLVEQRTQAALGAFTNRRALPGYSHPKNGSPRPALLGLPLSGKPPCFSTLIHFCCRPKSISSSSCSLPPILLTQRR